MAGVRNGSERRVVELLTRGLLNKQIAWELGLSISTVKSHVHHVMRARGIQTRTELAYRMLVDTWNG